MGLLHLQVCVTLDTTVFFSLNYNNQIAENVKFGFVLSRDKRYYLDSTFIGAARLRIFEDTGRPFHF